MTTYTYPKQPQNPFSARGQELSGVVSPINSSSSRRMLFCSSLMTFALFVILLFSFDSIMDRPEISTAEAERRVGGLRSHFKFLPQVLVSLSPKEESAATDADHEKWVNNNWLRDDSSSSSQEDDNEEEEEELVLDPEYQVTKNKRIGETKEKVKQEHQQLHASVQNHVFGQENNVEQHSNMGQSVRKRQRHDDEITPVIVVPTTKVDVGSGAAGAVKVQKEKTSDDAEEEEEEEEEEKQEEISLAAILKNEPIVNGVDLVEEEHFSTRTTLVEENSASKEEEAELSAILQNEPAAVNVISEDQ